MGWNYWSIPKLQRLHRWSLGMDKWFHPTFYNECNYLSMLGLKLNHVSKRSHWWWTLNPAGSTYSDFTWFIMSIHYFTEILIHTLKLSNEATLSSDKFQMDGLRHVKITWTQLTPSTHSLLWTSLILNRNIDCVTWKYCMSLSSYVGNRCNRDATQVLWQ